MSRSLEEPPQTMETATTKTASSSSHAPNRPRIRFYELCSIIPSCDLDEQASQATASGSNTTSGRPRLCSRAYSLPVPTSITSIFNKDCIPEEFKDDPAYMPNSPPRLNIRLPSFTRRKRSASASSQPGAPLQSCLKYTNGSTSRARPSSPSSSQQPSPVYCPALARISSANSTGTSPTSPSATTEGSNDLPSDLTPLRDCCSQCHKAAAYGASNPNYKERWSKTALAKRERDEQVKYERGECAVKTFFSKMCPEENKNGNLTPVPEAVDELEFAQKRMSLHHHLNAEVVEQLDETDSDSKEASDAQTISSASMGSSASHMSSRGSISTAATTPPSFEGGAPLGRPCSKPTRSSCINPNFDKGGAMHKEILAALQDADVQLPSKKGGVCSKREEHNQKQQQKGWARFTSFGKGLSMMPAVH